MEFAEAMADPKAVDATAVANPPAADNAGDDEEAMFNKLAEEHGVEVAPSTEPETAIEDDPQLAQPPAEDTQRERGPDGRFLPKKEEPAASAAGEPSTTANERAPQAQAKEEEGSEPAPPPEGFDKALAAHLRANARTEEQIERDFKEDPELFVKQGLELAKMQADQDNYGREYREWKTKQGDSPAQQQVRSEPEQTQPQRTPEVQPSADIQKAIEEIKANEDWDMGKLSESLGSLVQAVRQDAIAQANQTIGELNQKVETLMQKFEDDRVAKIESDIQDARKGLVKQYPSLADDQVFDAILEKNYQLVLDHDPTIASVAEAVEKAVKLENLDVNTDTIRKRLLSQASARRNGTPRKSTARTPTNQLTPDQEDEQAFYRMRKKHLGAFE